ncbi:hypothetical protein WJX81_004115 [Elliptochloris bilobata]|uniref:EF-hand domain-containing protein n=1 Tax=Elliptochloris bilobata TaxID=381761 RepID=A0AAW1QKL0_9CHLO
MLAILRSSSDSVASQLRLQQTFDEIDGSNKGFVDAAGLTAFAERNRLPAAYVPAFLSALLHGDNSSDADSADSSQRISFERFAGFVRGREASLRRTYDTLDADGNGVLTAREVEAGLSHVCITCPQTRCQYRSRPEALRRLLATLPAEGGISFAEFRRLFMLLPSSDLLVDYWIRASCPAACDIGGCVVVRDEKNSKGSPWRHLAAGAAAGAASRTATAPLEMLRLQAMAGCLEAPGLAGAFRATLARGGWPALYKGNLLNVVKSAPQKAIDFFAFDVLKGLLAARGGSGALPTFAAAGLAGAAGSIALYPLEVVRCRMTTDVAGVYRGPVHAASALVRSGGLPALYQGLGPSLAAIAPEAAITYGLFDLLKKVAARVAGQPQPGVLPSVACGVAAAFTGQLVAFPLEAIARRMQRGGPGQQSVLEVTRELLSRGGIRGLYQGVGAASLRVVPMAFVSFLTYEAVRTWLTQQEERAAERACAQAALPPQTCPLLAPA